MNEEYVAKNIRVVPMSGPSVDNQSEHTSKYYASGMGAGTADSDVEDNKLNKEAQIQLIDQRHQVKEKKAEAERKA